MINNTLLPLVEEFYTLQGEGAYTGTAAWFIRLGGCDVGCSWCDAKETWNPRLHPPVPVAEIISRAMQYKARTVVVTGGEPLMYPLDGLCKGLHEKNLKIHLETSGSHPFSGSFDWVCLSPKRKQPPLDEAWAHADELKVIIETPEDIEWAEQCAAKAIAARKNNADGIDRRTECAETISGSSPTRPLLFLQPEWSRRDSVMPVLVEYIKQNPRWRMSLQSHKYMRIP
jgi:organic radical activating enzyme